MSILRHAKVRGAQDATANDITDTAEQLDYLVLEVASFGRKKVWDILNYEVLWFYSFHGFEVVTKKGSCADR